MTNAVVARDYVPARKASKFISRTFHLVSDHTTDDIISWTADGRGFCIHDELKLAKLLPQYFRHDNVASFIRSLNRYGFVIVSRANGRVYAHPAFRADQPKLLAAFSAAPALPGHHSLSIAELEAPAQSEHATRSLKAEVDALRAQVALFESAQAQLVQMIELTKQSNEALRIDLRAARDSHSSMARMVDVLATFARADEGVAYPQAAVEAPSVECDGQALAILLDQLDESSALEGFAL